MDIHYDPKPGLASRSAIALGFFDGVHPGHQVVIGKAVAEAKRLNARCGVVTFKDHPRSLTRGQSPLLLTTIDQRLDLFASLGVDLALVLTFSEELCRLSPIEYVRTVLVESLSAKSISVGHNHHFGRDREGDAELLRRLGGEHDYIVHVADMVTVDGQEVSSTRIRELIAAKDLELAATLLSRPFTLRGEVVAGDSRGRQIGFPTANVRVASNHLIAPVGVYVARVVISGSDINGTVINNNEISGAVAQSYPAVVNIGTRPTFDGAGHEVRVEAHLLDFEGDLYNRVIDVQLLKFVRDEQKFGGIEALINQIAADCQVARCYLSC